MKYIFLPLALLLTACSITTPPVSEYRIAPKVELEKAKKSRCTQQSLKVSQVFSSSVLMTNQMRYVQEKYKEMAFNESKWSISPRSAVNVELVKSIRESGIFFSVQSYKSRSRSDLVLETNIEEFVQHFSNDNKKSFVRVLFSLSLVDVKSGRVLDTERVSQELPTKSLDAQGGVEALNIALADVLKQSNKWLSEVCQ